MTVELQEFTNKHRLMMEALVYDGLTPNEACDKYGMTYGRFSLIRRSPLWVLEEGEMRVESRLARKNAMEAMLPKALTTLNRNMECGSPATEVVAAKAVCDRAGMPANLIVTEGESVTDSDALYDTLKSIRDAKQLALQELGVDSVDDLIDVEATHIDEGASEGRRTEGVPEND